MSGIHNGVQAVMRRDNEAALYSPCACHSLNLCGSNAAQCCSEVTTFFGMVQKLYVFFSASPQRWEILQEQLTRVLMSSIWIKVLSAIDERNKILQTRAGTVDVEVQNLRDLLCDLQSIRDQWIKIWDEPVLVAKGLQMPIKYQKPKSAKLNENAFLTRVQNKFNNGRSCNKLVILLMNTQKSVNFALMSFTV
eukprot:Em0001g438a